jgi:ubiquinone/menaquinone biosynthesis C-methylase UbiE
VEAHEYQTLFDMEPTYWWFKGLHGIILDTLLRLGINESSKVLDAGCGTGQNLVNIRSVAPEALGFDYSLEASKFWRKRGLDEVCVASINSIPFPDLYFDAVVSVDVLESEAVDEQAAIRESARVLKPGGKLLLVLPAYEWMMTPEHHKAVGASRRYSKNKIRNLMSSHPLKVERMTHLFSTLFPAIAAYRVKERLFYREHGGPPRSELEPMHPILNKLFVQIVNYERMLLRKLNLPFGSSIMIICEKMP